MSLSHHMRALGSAWRNETARRRRARRREWVDTEFLPAALEATETPPPPLGRAVIWIIVAVTAAAITWAWFAKVDTVATAEGRVVPSGHLRSVEAADPGIVRQILVREGDRVIAGQPLVDLDATVARADLVSAQAELATASLERARATALLTSHGPVATHVIAPPRADSMAVLAEQQAVDARYGELQARIAGLDERRAAAAASVRESEASVEKLEQTAPLAARQVAAFQTLTEKGFGSQLRLDQERERYIGIVHDIDVERAKTDEARAQVAALSRDIAQATEEFRGEAAKEKAEAEGVIETRAEQLRKAARRTGLQTLRAPVTGTIQEVAVTNVGQVAEAGKPLVTVVPSGEPLLVEALLLNRDIGAVHVGDRVVIKVEAYPFTKYGTLTGHVRRVSPDAIVDEKRGLVFPISVAIDTAGKIRGNIHLSPGMSASVEVVSGHRRVLEYLWSPVAKAALDAGHER